MTDPTDLKDDLKGQVTEFLPEAIKTVLANYQLFRENMDHMKESKNFKDHHSAAKAAIAHLELLLKLAEKLETSQPHNEGLDQQELAAMLDNAKAEVDKYKSHEA